MKEIGSSGYREEVRIVAGESVVMRLRASDPAGLGMISVRCGRVGGNSSASAIISEALIRREESLLDQFEVLIHFPPETPTGQWQVQVIEFTNLNGVKTRFERGHGKFDDIVIDVASPEAELLDFLGRQA